MLQKDLELIRQTSLGEVNLLSAFGVLRLVRPESILRFQKEHPDIIFRYREYPDLEVERLFDQREGNVAFSIAPFDPGKYEITPIAVFGLSMIVHKQHPLALSGRRQAYITDLKGEAVYLESESFKIHHIVKNACHKAGFTPDIVFRTSGFSLCKSAVSRGSGVSVVVSNIYQEMADSDVVMIPFAAREDLQWNVNMLTRAGEPVTKAVKTFQKFVQNVLPASLDA